jgi:hypothetical protein
MMEVILIFVGLAFYLGSCFCSFIFGRWTAYRDYDDLPPDDYGV